MTDRDILAVINPPASERERTALVAAGNTILPSQSAWRMQTPIGKKIASGVRANFFAVNPTSKSGMIVNYHVHIYKVDRTGAVETVDVAATEDTRVTTSLLLRLKKKHPEWNVGNFAYDNRSSLYTSNKLPFTAKNDRNEPFFQEIVGISTIDEGESMKKRYSIHLTEIAVLYLPTTPAGWADLDAVVIRALDTAVFSFARWEQVLDNPTYFLVGSKIFYAHSDSFPLAPSYIAKRGFYSSLKSCMSGLCLVVDMSVNCFMASGDMPELMFRSANYRNFEDFYRDAERGLRPDSIAKINKVIKNAKIKLNHLGHWRKARELGPPSNSKASEFDYEGKRVTVAAYFEIMSKTKPEYSKCLKNGKLKYPALPTINIGSLKKPVLVPSELISVPGGQSRSQVMDGEMTALMIRHAAVRPEERMKFISEGDSATTTGVVNLIRNDSTAADFGLSKTSLEPMMVPACVLPQAKLRYAGDKMVDPGFNGTWNIDRPQMKFVKAPPAPNKDGSYTYGVLVVGNGPPPGPWKERVAEFTASLEKDGLGTGVKLHRGGDPMPSNDRPENLLRCFEIMKKGGARIVMVLMVTDSYGFIKLVSDKMGLPTQCVKWKNVDRPPRGFHLNLLIKLNTKLGGTNHTLISRATVKPGSGLFQDPPASLSWLFDKPCMLVGIDVSHAEPGSDRESMAAVVASMDGRASQYVAHLSAQNCRVEMVHALTDAMMSLLTSFKERNGGKMPAHIIIFRDGVSDGQFDQVIEKELPAVKSALELMGYMSGSVRIAIVICQKGHHTRLVYDEAPAGAASQYINPCPGLVVDSSGGNKSIVNANINEFYLNSHAAIQGTAKPCKYALIFDEIGFKLSELELLTYWTTYLYARCNKSVSYATPAYYAHWASKRAKDLFAAGGKGQDLLDISAMWARNEGHSTMFFI